MHGGILVLGILFLTVVAPIWITAHYGTRWRSARKLSAESERELAELWDCAKRIEARLDSLEAVLDAESPGWRKPDWKEKR
jgi:phage shock protein B